MRSQSGIHRVTVNVKLHLFFKMSKNIVLIKFYLVCYCFFFVLNDTIFVKILNLKIRWCTKRCKCRGKGRRLKTSTCLGLLITVNRWHHMTATRGSLAASSWSCLMSCRRTKPSQFFSPAWTSVSFQSGCRLWNYKKFAIIRVGVD